MLFRCGTATKIRIKMEREEKKREKMRKMYEIRARVYEIASLPALPGEGFATHMSGMRGEGMYNV